jgi:hypothetical protein
LTRCTSIRPYLVNIYFMELFTVLLSYLVNYTFECPQYTSIEETASGYGEYQRICWINRYIQMTRDNSLRIWRNSFAPSFVVFQTALLTLWKYKMKGFQIRTKQKNIHFKSLTNKRIGSIINLLKTKMNQHELYINMHFALHREHSALPLEKSVDACCVANNGC